ncbi:cation diffusion facilitator family transporter [uncultured Martelella sp.]|uniref:cation diffusion facilitator family transporter n=1 Tax=uncultured Martelella sp. TaxID=392331 RepID=UPI0029C940E9|nr:cation diffusion facilitator family transporter [uncultured Martelella sp.]
MSEHHHGHGGHSHHGGHVHGGHGHSHAPQNFGRAFAIGISLNIIYVVLEAVFGVFTGSLALLADAGHNLSDVLGLVLAWGAIWLAAKPPGGSRTYGFKRAPILASLANAIILIVAVGAISWEAIGRFFEPEPIETGVVIWVALAGVLVNGFTAWLFASGRKSDLNIRGAYLHMAADAGVTVGVIIAAIVIGWTGWTWIDPAVSLVIGLVILIGTWGLLRDSVRLAMDTVPAGIDIDKVRRHIEGAEGVEEVHDLHIWALSTTETALTAHIVCAEGHAKSLLATLPDELHDTFEIGHATLQMETADTAENCRLRPSEIV